jgi:hypothetical protein
MVGTAGLTMSTRGEKSAHVAAREAPATSGTDARRTAGPTSSGHRSADERGHR